MRSRSGLAGVAALLALTACTDGGGRREAEVLPPAEASARVSELLYGQNLIADPEVNAKMNEYVLAVSRDGVPVDSVMPEFHRWLSQWARKNSDRVAAVRPGQIEEGR